MSNFVNRNDLSNFVRSGNDPLFANTLVWLIVPPGSANETLLTTVPSKYLIITGDVISEVDQATKDAIDAALISARRDEQANSLDDVDSDLRAFALVVLDEINVLRSQHALADRTIAQLKTAFRNKLGT